MFTPGFKYFFGLAMFGLVSAFIYGLSSGDVTGPDYFGFIDRGAVIGLISLGWKGNIGSGFGYVVLLSLAAAAGYVGLTVVGFRDADVESVAELGDGSIPTAQRPTAPSYWPMASAMGVGVVMMGLVLDQVLLWWLGLAMMAIVAVEWAMSTWADRATGDAELGAVLRQRVMAPVEIPVLALAVALVAALAISRILLAVSKLGAVAVAGVVGLVIFGIAILAVVRPKIDRRVMGLIVALVAAGIIVAGIVAAAVGPREFHHLGEGDHGSDHSEQGMVSTK